ncbi:hypothetical protein HanRHA438_Chr16g0750591 [Helianthus annuus]|nr:hypothetical protein HanIR_Chr16g0802641 [Helianthus annuus]KAJ0835042.1 hypothetical protein HanRHA438_Chr16g0750591 [Helianthus annuus]
MNELLTRRQDYETTNGGFGRGEVKPLSDGTAEKDVGVQRVNLCVVEKNDKSTSGAASCVDKWVDELAALRARIEKALGDRLSEEPNNEVHRRLKRKYIEVLDVLPCFPVEGLEAFEEGEMVKGATGSTSSPPPALSGERGRGARDGMDVASHSGDEDEAVNLNLLISGIAKTAEVGGGVSLGYVSLVLDTLQTHAALHVEVMLMSALTTYGLWTIWGDCSKEWKSSLQGCRCST